MKTRQSGASLTQEEAEAPNARILDTSRRFLKQRKPAELARQLVETETKWDTAVSIQERDLGVCGGGGIAAVQGPSPTSQPSQTSQPFVK